PWQYLAALVDDFRIEDFRFGSYYICCGTKPERDLTDRRLLPASRRPLANRRSPSQRSRRKPDKQLKQRRVKATDIRDKGKGGDKGTEGGTWISFAADPNREITEVQTGPLSVCGFFLGRR